MQLCWASGSRRLPEEHHEPGRHREDWRTVLHEATGDDLSTRAMAEYFGRWMGWLEEQNRGRVVGCGSRRRPARAAARRRRASPATE